MITTIRNFRLLKAYKITMAIYHSKKVFRFVYISNVPNCKCKKEIFHRFYSNPTSASPTVLYFVEILEQHALLDCGNNVLKIFINNIKIFQ